MDDESGAYIHYEDPFATPRDKRSEVRRLRGSLASGVTIWTAGTVDRPAGLTVSSLMVADGDPPRILGLLNDTTDLFTAVETTGGFVVHVLGDDAAEIADRFAGLRPSPGGLFVGSDLGRSENGPVLERFPDRAHCRVESIAPAGYHRLVTARVERIELQGLERPLVFFRGRYRKVAETETIPEDPRSV